MLEINSENLDLDNAFNTSIWVIEDLKRGFSRFSSSRKNRLFKKTGHRFVKVWISGSSSG